MMCRGVSLFAFFAVLAPFINATIGIKYEDGFLAGEETPVWLASVDFDTSDHRAQYSYKRLTPEGTPIVKESLDYWNSINNGSGFPVRKIRSINDRENFTYTEQFRDGIMQSWRIKRFDFPSPVEKRSTDSNNVLYPSILVVMNYDNVFEIADKKTSWNAKDFVLYALAFWGTVASSLKNVQTPKVSLRIAGIVITTSRKASPYLNDNRGEKTFVDALSPMMDYWLSVADMPDSEFPYGSFDIVAHMTDIYPWSGYIEWTSQFRANNPILGVASDGPVCASPDRIGGLIIRDNLAFDGIQRAIAQMSKVLTGSDQSELDNGYPRRRWTKEILDSFSTRLKYEWCMSAPKQLHGFGTPVPPILAGELIPNGKQCGLAGYESDAWTCWDTSYAPGRSDCNYLQCSNQHIWGVTCSEVGLTLDGSFCNAENTKICLDGECVDKK